MAGSGDQGTTQNEQVLLQKETDACRNVSSPLAVFLGIFSSLSVGYARELNARWAIGPTLGHPSLKTWRERLGCGVRSRLSYFDVPQALVFSEDTTCLLGETLGVSFHRESLSPHCQSVFREFSSSQEGLPGFVDTQPVEPITASDF